jgi:hypothetical protein
MAVRAPTTTEEKRQGSPHFPATARRLGICSAASVVILGLAYAVTLAVGFLSLEDLQRPIGDPMFSIMEVTFPRCSGHRGKVWHPFDPRSHCRTALMAVRG